VEPAATPLAAGDRTELAAEIAYLLLLGRRDFTRQRTFADSRHVCLGHADDRVEAIRPDPGAGCRLAGHRVGRGDERICAVVEVEERPLGALEEDELAVAQRLVDQQGRVGDVRPQPSRVGLVAVGDLLERERLDVVHALEPDVLLGERDLDLLPQDLRVEDVLDADPDPRSLVRIGRPDPAARGTDLQVAEAPLAGLVYRHVPRHDEVRIPGQAHDLGGDAARLELVHLL